LLKYTFSTLLDADLTQAKRSRIVRYSQNLLFHTVSGISQVGLNIKSSPNQERDTRPILALL